MFTLSCVLILPAALQTSGNALSLALGHGPDTYNVPLCTGATVTHFGAHAWVQQSFVDTIQAASQGLIPVELMTLDEAGNPPISLADLQAVISNLIITTQEGGDPQTHWQSTLAANGLAVQQVENPL